MKCYIVFHEKMFEDLEYKFLGFKVSVKNVDKLREKLVTKCTTKEEILSVYNNPDLDRFEALADVNNYFNYETDCDLLFILRDDNYLTKYKEDLIPTWYCREKGSNVFVKVSLNHKETSTVYTYDKANISQVSIQPAAIVSVEEFNEVKEELEQLKNDFIAYKNDYDESQRLSIYVYIALIALMTVVGLIAIFRK